jgi:hypothetical protein
MKKLICSALMLVFILITGTAGAQNTGFRIIISEIEPAEINSLSRTIPFVMIDRFGISINKNGIFDYGIMVFIKTNSATPEIPDAYMLYKLQVQLDSNGVRIPNKYINQLAGVVFMDEKLAWFISKEAESVFKKATN